MTSRELNGVIQFIKENKGRKEEIKPNDIKEICKHVIGRIPTSSEIREVESEIGRKIPSLGIVRDSVKDSLIQDELDRITRLDEQIKELELEGASTEIIGKIEELKTTSLRIIDSLKEDIGE